MPDSHADFYNALTPLEQTYWHRLLAVFEPVTPQKPEKGAQALIRRAQKLAREQGFSPETALASILADAQTRTHRRVALLNQCGVLNRPPQDPA